MTNKKSTLLILLLVLAPLCASIARAEDSYTELEDQYSPFYESAGDEYSPYYDPGTGLMEVPQVQPGTFSSLLGKTVKFGIVFAALMAAIIITAAGFMHITAGGNTGTITKARDMIWNAILGLLVVIGAYLILYTINPNLVNMNFLIEPLKIKTTEIQTSPPSTFSDSEIREWFANASGGKISINAAEPQTSLNGVREETRAGIIALWNACGQCNLVITGGTEEEKHAPGQYSHSSGYKIDLRPNNALKEAVYKQINYTKDGKLVNCDPTKNTCPGKDGNLYRYETDHWDICFQCKK